MFSGDNRVFGHVLLPCALQSGSQTATDFSVEVRILLTLLAVASAVISACRGDVRARLAWAVLTVGIAGDPATAVKRAG
ncbi:hypothetical protein FHR83_002031 [Actinoplanes campanulatus]|uniref:Uncharacterized protein n=1 Tax=Actinoplanes campanulatus TaxID=113559 RepID=A0A7W5AEM9_9ACTN|nr:hypothetical protein [Actinoplanes campanulatus]MBB3094379.1 hypothetical protein [Actinoplanes campanulatus]